MSAKCQSPTFWLIKSPGTLAVSAHRFACRARPTGRLISRPDLRRFKRRKIVTDNIHRETRLHTDARKLCTLVGAEFADISLL